LERKKCPTENQPRYKLKNKNFKYITYMSAIQSFIKLFDVYGNYFQMRINNQAKFKTLLGGIFSIITFIILILCLFSMGSDFFTKQNPKISIEEGLFQEDEIPTLNGTEYPLKPVLILVSKSFSNIAKLKINVVNSKANTLTTKFLDECGLDYIKEHFPELEKSYTNSITSYCFNLNDYPLDQWGMYSITHSECSVIESSVLQNMTDKGITCRTNSTTVLPVTFFTLYTKQIGFKPELENPFINKTVKYYFGFINTFKTTVNINWNLNYLSDDHGWIADNMYDTTELAPQQESQRLLPTDAKKVPVFSVSFTLNEKFRRFTRIYQKLQDILASLGGFMKLIFTVLNLISMLIRTYLIDLYIMDEKFEIEKPKSKEAKELAVTRNVILENSQYSKFVFN
jgi:hypothetical protein